MERVGLGSSLALRQTIFAMLRCGLGVFLAILTIGFPSSSLVGRASASSLERSQDALSATESGFASAAANSDWSSATFTGQVMWEMCGSTPCSWEIWVSTVPGNQRCPEKPDRAIWISPNQYMDGPVDFDTGPLPLAGGRNLRACLNVRYSKIVIGIDEAWTLEGSALMTEAMSRSRAIRIAKRKLGVRFGKSWRKGSHKVVRCVERPAKFECSAKWEFKGKQRHALVPVPK